MDLGLEGRRALVGGGASGIGGGIATALAAEGARVALVGRTAARVEAEAARLDGAAVMADLSTPDGPAGGGRGDGRGARRPRPAGRQHRRAARRHVRHPERGGLGAGDRGHPPVGPAPAPRGAAAPARGRDPSILIVLSSSARKPIPALTTSNLIRPGLAGLIKSLTEEIAPIRINGLAPGRIATDRIAWLDSRRAEAAGDHARGDRRADAGDDPAGPLRRRSRRSAGSGRSCCRRRRRS